jgi:hypothetical protein
MDISSGDESPLFQRARREAQSGFLTQALGVRPERGSIPAGQPDGLWSSNLAQRGVWQTCWQAFGFIES